LEINFELHLRQRKTKIIKIRCKEFRIVVKLGSGKHYSTNPAVKMMVFIFCKKGISFDMPLIYTSNAPAVCIVSIEFIKFLT
jgi:hypothetical protein